MFKKLIYLQSPALRSLIDCRHSIELNSSLSQEVKPTHDFVECRKTSLILTVLVMYVCRTINGDTDQKIIQTEKVSGFFCYESAVGLKGIMYDFSFCVSALQFNGLAIEIQPHDKRFTSVPVECHFRNIIGRYIFSCKLFKRLKCHSWLLATIYVSFVKIIAIMTTKITQRTRWLNHQIKRKRAL